jgi:hypothetical protein
MGLKYLPETSFLYNEKYVEDGKFISGIYRGRKWIIFTHYCPSAYISCTEDEINKYKCEIDEKVHGSITFEGVVYYKEKNHGIVYDCDYNNGDVICMGWDYGHLYDYKLYYYDFTGIRNQRNNKIWKLREILEHIRIAIDTIIDETEIDK